MTQESVAGDDHSRGDQEEASVKHGELVDQESATAARPPSRVRLFFVVGSLTALISNLATLWTVVLSAFLVILIPLRELQHAEGQAVNGELVDRIDLMMMQAAISIGVAIVAAVLYYLIRRRYRRSAAS